MVIDSPFDAIAIPHTPLVPYVLQHATALADKPALVCGATGHTYTYAALADAVRRAA